MDENKNEIVNEVADKETEATETQEETVEAKTEKTSFGEKKKLKKAEEQIAQLEASLAEENDKYMRLYAEYDNFRRRSQKEKEGIYSDAYVDALTQILPILDNLERAAQYGGDDKEHPLSKGLELTLKSFRETLEKMGVKEIEAMGKTFDPNLHNAVFHVDDESYGESEIVEVLMKGYTKGDKVIRYSMVKVAN